MSVKKIRTASGGKRQVRLEPEAVEAENIEPRPGDKWNCGNGHLHTQAALTLIEKNGVTDVEAMRWLDDAAYEAGPDFCRDLLNARIPF